MTTNGDSSDDQAADDESDDREFRRDPDTGRRLPEHSDADLLTLLEDHGPLSTRAVADEMGYHIETTRYRLQKLEQEGKVEHIDAREFVWFVPE